MDRDTQKSGPAVCHTPRKSVHGNVRNLTEKIHICRIHPEIFKVYIHFCSQTIQYIFVLCSHSIPQIIFKKKIFTYLSNCTFGAGLYIGPYRQIEIVHNSLQCAISGQM